MIQESGDLSLLDNDDITSEEDVEGNNDCRGFTFDEDTIIHYMDGLVKINFK